MYFSLNDRGSFSTMVYNWPHDGTFRLVIVFLFLSFLFNDESAMGNLSSDQSEFNVDYAFV